MSTLTVALDLHRRGRHAEAESVCRSLLMHSWHEDALKLLADIQSSSGRIADAAETLGALAHRDPKDAANLRRLGSAQLALGRNREAEQSLRHALEIEPGNARGHNNLGQALLRLGQVQEALRCYERALAIDSKYAIAHHNRGLALLAAGDLESALLAQQAAVRLEPKFIAAHLQIASISLLLERAEEALRAADRVLNFKVDSPDAYIAKAGALGRLHRPLEALMCLRQLLSLHPDHASGWCHAAVVHLQLGDDSAALDSYRHASSCDADHLPARSGLLAALIPAIAGSSADADDARERLSHELASFESWLEGRVLDEGAAWELARQQFFYLSYHESCNRAVLERFRALSSLHLARHSPYDGLKMAVGAPPRRLKVGIVSAHLFDHSVFRAITSGWLDHLDRNRLEIHLFHLGAREDDQTRWAQGSADHFDGGVRSPMEWARRISNGHFDVLLYPEVGIDRTTLALANLKLAPRQFAAWGHPETTGLPGIDAYLSGELFEPEDADTHYTEALIRLPNLGVACRRWAMTSEAIDVERFGLSGDSPVLICPGTPFKYLPGDDAVWVEIARRLKQCSLVFFQHDRTALTHKLKARLSAAFERAGLDADRFLKWIPWQPSEAFFGILKASDVYLDTLGFSGFNTFLLAVEAGIPMVSHEGLHLRGRLGTGILKRLRMTELIAESRAQYVDIAVRLATDKQAALHVRRDIGRAAPVLYDDVPAVAGLERVLTGGFFSEHTAAVDLP